MKLLQNWNIFKNKVEEFLREADNLILKECTIIQEDDASTILLEINVWIYKIYGYLKDSFDDSDNEFAQSFYFAKLHGLYLKTENTPSMQKIADAFEELKAKRKKLEYILRLLSVCDAIIQNDLIDLTTRSKFSQEEIMDLILDKLYYLQDNFYYPLQTILLGNGIVVDSSAKLTCITNALEKRGYIWVIYSKVVKVQLSLDGRNHIDHKRHFESFETNKIGKTIIETTSINNNDKSKINEPGLVKAILKNEIINFQALYSNLFQKSWSELLKEKLDNLESTKVICKDKVSMIFQTMTSD